MHTTKFQFNIPVEFTKLNDPSLFVEVTVEHFGPAPYSVHAAFNLATLCCISDALGLSEKIFEHAKNLISQAA